MASINSINYQLRIWRQKTLNLSPIEAHFGRKANTPLSKISTDSNPNTLTYEPILNKYFDPETIRWGELFSKYRLENGNRSDDEIERKRSTLSHNS